MLLTRRSRVLLVSLLGLVAVGGGAGLLLHGDRPSKPVARPSAEAADARRVAAQPEILHVVSASPAPDSKGVALEAPIAFAFNLPVDAGAVAPYFTILPDVRGAFERGATGQEVRFAPARPFSAGSAISVVLRKGLPGPAGTSLPEDFAMTFLTSPPAEGVSFESSGRLARLLPVRSGAPVQVTLRTGPAVGDDLKVRTFRATAADLLQALVHAPDAPLTVNRVDTARLVEVDSRGPLRNGAVLEYRLPDGIYVAVALAGGRQVGAFWLDFSRYAVAVRQDDQKIVAAGVDLAGGSEAVPVQLTLYDLTGGVRRLGATSFTGTGELASPYPALGEVAVATAGGQDVVVPLAIPETGADVKVLGGLGGRLQLFLVTDKLGYTRGETVRFAGQARFSNDQAYTAAAGAGLKVWIGEATKPIELAAGPDGRFSGAFPMPDSAFADPERQLAIRVTGAGAQAASEASSVTSVRALAGSPGVGAVAVALDKPAYLVTDTITASVKAPGLAGRTVSLAMLVSKHATRPAESDAFAAPTLLGTRLMAGIPLQLDASGAGTYTFSSSLARASSDQELTITVATTDAIVGARSAVLYQAKSSVFLLPGRAAYGPGSEVYAPFVVENRDGSRAAAQALTYEVSHVEYQNSHATSVPVASGSVTSDARGMGVIRFQYTGPSGVGIVRLSGRDAAGNSFQDSRELTIGADDAVPSYFGASDGLRVLDVSTDRLVYSPGDVARLSVRSPAAGSILLSGERGRIHFHRLLNVVKGDNQVQIEITPDLAPGFTATFSHFRDGVFVSEGLPIAVSARDRLLKVTISPPAGIAPGQPAQVAITVTDSKGAPVSAGLIVSGYEAAMVSGLLVDQPSLAGAFLAPALRSTNASSSMSGIGSWGGRCGGGLAAAALAPVLPGGSALWAPALVTDAAGRAIVPLPGSAPLRLAVMAATAGAFGQAEADLGSR